MQFDWHAPDSERLPLREPLDRSNRRRRLPTRLPQPRSLPTRALPAIYLGHGAPMLLDDQEWVGQLGAWANSCLAQSRS